MTIKAKKSKINLREKLAELLNFRQIRDRLDGLGLYLGKDRTGTAENVAVRGGANVDDLQLAEISAALGGTAVDVFVYDTRKDSDGGAWRHRTQHTSWYNEELNTATRGGRREFPAVAVIIAEAKKVTIYDGDDPDLPMWMVINQVEWNSVVLFRDVVCVNATMVIGSGSGITVVNFINNKMSKIHPAAIYTGDYVWGELLYNPPVLVDYGLIIHNAVNDVAMTVLPNAPIDADTGLPIPTIAVATDGGISVIKDDGTVVDIICGQTSFVYSYHVIFDQSNRLFLSIDGQDNSRRVWGLNNIPATDLVVSTDTNSKQNGDIFIADDNGFGSGKDMFLFNESNPHATEFAPDNSIGTNKNLFKSFINKEDSSKSLYNYITSKYNTGWMPGDIKLATLSDTTVETIGTDGSNLLGGNNSSFTSGVGDWVDISIGSGSVVYNTGGRYVELARTDANNNARIAIGLNLQAGQMYFLRFSLVDSGTSGVQVKGFKSSDNSFSANQIINSTASQDGTYTVSFRAEDGYDGIMFIPISGTNTVANLDSVSIRATTELITNGDFSNGTTGWDPISDPVLTTVNEGVNLKVSSGDNQAGFYRNISANDVNQQYILSFQASDFIGDTAANLMVSINDYKEESPSEITGNVEYISTKEDGSYSVSFNGRSGGVMIFFRIYDLTGTCSEDTSMNIKNISVRLAEDDRSVNDNGLQIFGEITKSAVAPGADLVAYSGFSADNYLMQPYNSDLNGLNSFSIMGWVKRNGTITTEQPFVSFKDTSDDGVYSNGDTFMLFGTTSNHQLFFQTHEQSTSTDASQTVWSGETIEGDTWANFCLVYDDSTSTTKIFINGKMVNSATKNTGPVYLSNSVMTIGSRFKPTIADHVCDQVDLSIIRVSETIPTDAQIAKIYRDEKVLFQDGAQATLYGTSDAVTALAYDDKTELLHVGTSSGRSDFSGLRRINNTTTAVTTSISASNNLIAEQ